MNADQKCHCAGCESTNIPNATWGIVQLIECNNNEIDTPAEALEFIEAEVRAVMDWPDPTADRDIHDRHPALDDE